MRTPSRDYSLWLSCLKHLPHRSSIPATMGKLGSRIPVLPGMALHSLRDHVCGQAQQKGQFPCSFFPPFSKRLVSVARGESKDIKTWPFTITQYLRSKRNPGFFFSLVLSQLHACSKLSLASEGEMKAEHGLVINMSTHCNICGFFYTVQAF